MSKNGFMPDVQSSLMAEFVPGARVEVHMHGGVELGTVTGGYMERGVRIRWDRWPDRETGYCLPREPLDYPLVVVDKPAAAG